MRVIDFKKLSFPANARMNLLSEALTQRELIKLLRFFANRPPAERVVRLPKKQTIIKSIIFYYIEQVECGKIKEKDAVRELKIKLGNLCPKKREIMRLYFQRKKEIQRENK